MSRALLEKALDNFPKDTGSAPKLGAELEFYLSGELAPDEQVALFDALHGEIPGVMALMEEDGPFQYEIQLAPTTDGISLCDALTQAKQVIEREAKARGLEASFVAKPIADEPGSGLHIHISLLDKEGNNLFARQGEEEAPQLLFAIRGLLERLPHSMAVFCPNRAAYVRYGSAPNAPSTISWGGNNRTVALRLPMTTRDPENRRIEHRIPASEADPYLSTLEVLEGVKAGLKAAKIPDQPKLYGNAFDSQYSLPPLPNPWE